MSIVALKRKTEAKYKNNSVNQKDGFSLYGSYRNQGYVGQTSLSRHLSRTLMKGTAVKGHGGCCGTYTHGPIVRSSFLSQEDNTVVKDGVLNNKGMLAERFSCDDCNVFKTTVATQSDLVNKLAKNCINESDTSYQVKTTEDISKGCLDGTVGKRIYCIYAKPESTYVAMSEGEYIKKLKKTCVDNDLTLSATNIQRTPFAGST